MTGRYDNFYSHGGMLLDDVRNSAYAAAINEVVGPGTTVLDLGAGLGLFGLLAAKAGARKVYLVDPSPVLLDVASVIEANGLQDRVHLINLPIQETKLPEQVDVLISVMTGNFLLQEDLLPSLFHARDRFLKPEGVLLPSNGVMVVAPVTLARPERNPAFRLVQELHGLDFTPVRRRFVNRVQFERYFDGDLEFLAPPEPLGTMSFYEASKSAVEATTSFTAAMNGRLDGVLGWFDLELGKNTLSTGPLAKPVHWKQAFMPFESPVSVRKGEALQFSLNRPERGEWTWTLSAGGVEQRMSTFFSQRPDVGSLQRRSPGHRLKGTPEGVSARFVLEKIADGATWSEVEDEFLRWDGRHLQESQSARTWLREFLDRFSS